MCVSRDRCGQWRSEPSVRERDPAWQREPSDQLEALSPQHPLPLPLQCHAVWRSPRRAAVLHKPQLSGWTLGPREAKLSPEVEFHGGKVTMAVGRPGAAAPHPWHPLLSPHSLLQSSGSEQRGVRGTDPPRQSWPCPQGDTFLSGLPPASAS